MATSVTTAEEYLASQAGEVRAALERVREIILDVVPDATESISYKMLAYKLRSTPVVYLAGFKRHWSLYPATPALAAALKGELEPHLYGKGTIRFDIDQPVPAKLVRSIVRIRAGEAVESARPRGRGKSS